MGEPKTRPTDTSVDVVFASVADARRRADAEAVCALMHGATGDQPAVWGTNIVGFGSVEVPQRRGPATPWPMIAFAPRKTELVLYLHAEIEDDLFADLGPHRRGVGCLYLKRLDDVDQQVLARVVARSVALSRSS